MDNTEIDKWGNIKGVPFNEVEEHNGSNFIKIDMFELAIQNKPKFFFGFRLKIDKLARQKTPNIANESFNSVDDARIAAQNMIIDLCRKNKIIKKLLADFTLVKYNQPELFL